MKVCRIINGRFSWRLEVDGRKVLFSGADNAEYFKAHYAGLGYAVELTNEN